MAYAVKPFEDLAHLGRNREGRTEQDNDRPGKSNDHGESPSPLLSGGAGAPQAIVICENASMA
jgi:hypothetical protein